MQNRNNSTSHMLTALGKHVGRFTDANSHFSPYTVSEGLATIHGHQSSLKGTVIAAFNATHASNHLVCPVTHASFIPDAQTGYAKNLHMGTTRIWDPDGTINEPRWQQFVSFVTADQNKNEEQIVTLSKLKEYLKKCYETDAQDPHSGRNTNALFSSKAIQGAAASAGWDEVFDRLTCGWKAMTNKPTELEPYITLKLIREFF